MVVGNSKYWLGVFFCSVGCICSTSALGADGDSQVASGFQIDSPALFETSSNDDALPQGQQVEVGSFGEIDLHVKDLDLTKVLQLLSIQSQRNIIASRNVAGTVSADLYGVDFYEAMDAILHTNGFGYREKGRFIYVYTTEEIAQLEDENRELVYEIVRLNYLNAADASAFVTPLLSGNGSIALSGEPDEGFEPTISDGGDNQSAHQDTLVIRDYAENVQEIIEVIDKLDTRPRQVLVEATILQARLTEDNAFGVDFAVFADLNVTDFTTPLGGSVDELVSGAFDSGSSVGTSTIRATDHSIKLGFVGSDAAVFVKALDSVTDTVVLSKPSVLVLNRQKVNLLVGERLGYLSSTATETSTTQTVEFLDVGTQLTLRPFISDDDFVRMELRPSVSSGAPRTVGSNTVLDTTTQEIITNVIVRSGQTIILGGLFTEDTTISRTNVPGLGNLPMVGPAFKGQDDTVKRSEVIFMIKPTIQKDEDLTLMADSVNEDIDSSRLGMREGLLPWSRTKLTSAYVRDAIGHMEDGDNDKALWSLDKALYLDPTMPDATRLKGQITGEKTYYYDRSILKRAVDSVIDAGVSANADDLSVEADQFEPEEFFSEQPEVEVPAADDLSVQADEFEPEDFFSEQPEVEVPAADDLSVQADEFEPEDFFSEQPEVEVSPAGDPSVKAYEYKPEDYLHNQPERKMSAIDDPSIDGIDPFEGDSSDWQIIRTDSGYELDKPSANINNDWAEPADGLEDQAEPFSFTDPATETQWVPNRDGTQVQSEAPWRSEVTGEGQESQAWQYDQAEDPQANIFEFVEGVLDGTGDDDAQADGESEAEVSSVDTDEVE